MILALNPGSTSTKLAVYDGDTARFQATVELNDTELSAFRGRPVLAQLESRLAAVLALLHEEDIDLSALRATVGRGGLLRPLESGTYRVTDAMLTELRQALRGDHASNLGASLARRLAEPAGCPSFIVDPVSVDEWPPVARLSGLEGLERDCLSHALNTKAVAKRHARQAGALTPSCGSSSSTWAAATASPPTVMAAWSTSPTPGRRARSPPSAPAPSPPFD